MGKNAHEQIARIKSDYLAAYAERWGQTAADRLTVSYRAGWFYLTASPLSTPYRAREMQMMTLNLRKRK